MPKTKAGKFETRLARLPQCLRFDTAHEIVVSMLSKDEVKAAFEEAKANQAQFSANPDTAAAKKTARIGGLMLLVAGAACGGIAYYLYASQGVFSRLVSASALTFFGFGLYLVVFGKMPKKR